MLPTNRLQTIHSSTGIGIRPSIFPCLMPNNTQDERETEREIQIACCPTINHRLWNSIISKKIKRNKKFEQWLLIATSDTFDPHRATFLRRAGGTETQTQK